MKIKLQPPGKLTPYKNNPRKITDEAIDLVAESIERFGFQQPIVVDSKNVIVVGHTRQRAALKLGLKRVPTVVATDLTPGEVAAYRLTDNRSAELTGWDVDMLSKEVKNLESITGFTTEELDSLRALDSLMAAGKVKRDALDLPDSQKGYVALTFNVPRKHLQGIRTACEKVISKYGTT